MKILKIFKDKKILTGGSFLLASLMFSNFLNFLFNAYLGRVLSFEDFGIVTLINTLWYFTSIFFSALGTTVSHKVAFISAKNGKSASAGFFILIRNKATIISFFLTLFWILITPFLASFFKTDTLTPVLIFSPVIVFGLLSSANRGYLQGDFYFISLAITIIIESIIKLSSTFLIVNLGYNSNAYLSIPLSITAAYIISQIIVSKKIVKTEKRNFKIPIRFYVAAVLTGVSSYAFLSTDILLVKHFLSPQIAGEYSLLSLVGKMIFFFSALLNGFIVPFASRDDGLRKNPNNTFYKILFIGAALNLIIYIPIGLLGGIVVPTLFGNKSLIIVPYLTLYGLAIVFYSIVNKIVIFHLSRHHYTFPIISLIFTFIMAIGIIFNHQNIADITKVVFATSLASFFITLALHFIQNNEKFLLSNIVDFIYLFKSIPKYSTLESKNNHLKKILIFNWRDTKHNFAGGAEVYVHELAKRWVKKGHKVTVFCGNDGKCLKNELVDGVEIVRRGGFYFVYFWAFVYYVFKFRGKYDVIIDSQNGLPFFTPLYAKEPIYSVLYHVHQEVFYKSLSKPLAFIASTLENLFMPWAYRNTKFITVSDSTKEDMKKINLTTNQVEIIHPGVDLTKLKPGIKNKTPLILYLGRLKAYKSIDILLYTYKKVLQTLPGAKLIIAGSGEEEGKLKKLAEKLGIIKNVEFKGSVTEEEKINLLQKAWILVNPSFMEGWGITTIEANACATPVVASDVPGLKDSVKNPHSGYLVEYGNIDMMTERILLLLGNKKVRVKMSKQSIKWAKKYDWEKTAIKCLKVLNEI